MDDYERMVLGERGARKSAGIKPSLLRYVAPGYSSLITDESEVRRFGDQPIQVMNYASLDPSLERERTENFIRNVLLSGRGDFLASFDFSMRPGGDSPLFRPAGMVGVEILDPEVTKVRDNTPLAEIAIASYREEQRERQKIKNKVFGYTV